MRINFILAKKKKNWALWARGVLKNSSESVNGKSLYLILTHSLTDQPKFHNMFLETRKTSTTPTDNIATLAQHFKMIF